MKANPKKERGPAEGGDVEWVLRLYVAGQTPNSIRAFANLKKICEEHLAGKYRIEIVDLLVNPERAKSDQVLAVPTLVRRSPAPMKRIIGDLANTEKVLLVLQVQSGTKSSD